MVASVTTEHAARIYNDTTGDYVEVSPDPDGLGLCQITKVEKGGPSICMIIEWEIAEALARTLKTVKALNESRGE